MSATSLVNALRQHRDGLVARWCRQFVDNRGAARPGALFLDEALAGALIDEVVSLLACEQRTDIPRRHRPYAFADLAPFPGNVAICIDVFQAGAQVIGAFVVENAGPFAAWSVTMRNRFLGEIDAVFHILVHREIEALCECRLDDTAAPATEPLPVAGLRAVPFDAISNN